jgi:hypothetical protein
MLRIFWFVSLLFPADTVATTAAEAALPTAVGEVTWAVETPVSTETEDFASSTFPLHKTSSSFLCLNIALTSFTKVMEVTLNAK